MLIGVVLKQTRASALLATHRRQNLHIGLIPRGFQLALAAVRNQFEIVIPLRSEETKLPTFVAIDYDLL